MKFLKLKNRRALITGASSGLGFEIAKGFINQGADLMICSRSKKNLENAFLALKKLKTEKQKIYMKLADISKKNECDDLLEESLKAFESVDILVNNAGIIGPKGNFENCSWNEWRNTIETNLFGSAYLIKSFLPSFKKNNYGRIIQISGGGATSPMPNVSAYSASKAGIVRFIETIAVELEKFNITANCIAPGALNTKMLEEYLEAGPEKLGEELYKKVLAQKKNGGAPIEKAVKLSVALASENYPKLKGKLISALWDDWENFSEYKDILNESDVYTIRRITARDRNYSWGDL